MKLVVNGKNQALEVVAFEAFSAEDFILREKGGVPKLVEGKATYRVPGLEVLEDGRRLHNVYVSLFTPQPIKRFTPYRFDGLTIVNVYSSAEGRHRNHHGLNASYPLLTIHPQLPAAPPQIGTTNNDADTADGHQHQ